MQDCFRDHPDVYGAELEDDEQEGQEEGAPSDALSEPSQPTAQPSPSPAPESGAGQTPTAPSEAKSTSSSKPASSSALPPSHASAEHPSPEEEKGRTERVKAATRQVREEHEPQSESDEMVPKAAFDATASNKGK